MDYEKKYKEALERAKRLHCEPTGGTERIVCEQIFPELKESDDDKIRKEILELVRQSSEVLDKQNQNNMIAWLERQGEHANFLSKIQVGDKVTRNEGGVLVNISQLERVAKPRRVKPIDKVEPKFKVKYAGSEYNVLEVKDFAGVTHYGIEDEPNHIDYVLPDNCEIVRDHSYGVKEKGNPYPTKSQMFTEQNEPKFHEGDWVIDKQGIVHQIAKVVENVSNHTYGYDIVGGGYFNDNTEGVISWALQDAKDGDVLAEDSCIFILKEMVNNSHAITHCTLFANGEFNDGVTLYFDIDSTKPATKEQRDLLFQKMKEAGYKWDTEKKELKKIEDEIEIPFGAKDSELQEVTYYIPKGFHAEIDDDKVVIKKGEKPAEWSEEDEETLEWLCRFLEKFGNEFYGGNEVNVIFWLKSLKDKVQPKQELDGAEIAPPIDSDVCG